MEERLPKGTLGGQAVIEGVMMKGTDSYSVAIRKPDKKIEVKLQKYQSFGDKHKWAKVPFIRGIVNFAESMVVGMKTLSYSSSFYEEEEEETKADKLIKEVFKEKAESVIMGLTLFCSVLLAIALFMMLPAAIGEFIGKWVDSRILLSLIEGIVRLSIFIIYVILISQMEDIRRVFMYHGAEHKTINCYEAGDELTPANVAKHSRYHKRCGTSFLFIVMVVSIIIFMFITADQMWLRFLLRLLLIPVVAGISYEFIKLAGKSDNAFVNILSKPGMWIQKLTTKEPEEEMIQVAIISVESVLYGMPYVDAVNEAQGLGKNAKKEAVEEVEEDVESDSSTDETAEDGLADGSMSDQVAGDYSAMNDVVQLQEDGNQEVTEEIADEEEISEEVQEEIEETSEIITEEEVNEVATEDATVEAEANEVAENASADAGDVATKSENTQAEVENILSEADVDQNEQEEASETVELEGADDVEVVKARSKDATEEAKDVADEEEAKSEEQASVSEEEVIEVVDEF